MGLDMYLERDRFIYDNERSAIKVLGLKNVNMKKVKSITEDVMYWRKANAIHDWFVQNVQEGNDDCSRYYVTREQLEKLLDDIMKALANKENAKNILPTAKGFFFGSTDYDEYYWEDMENTKETLMTVIANWDDSWSYYYQSSW